MAGRTLILLRNPKSDWSGNEPDLRRPLAARGRRQGPDAGRWLNTNVDRIDLAVVSPATRVRQTWDLAAALLRTTPPIRIDGGVTMSPSGLRDSPVSAVFSSVLV